MAHKKTGKKTRATRKKKAPAKAKATRPQSEFPLCLMKVNGERKFMTFREAYVTYDSGFAKVEFGRYVLNENFTVRLMTKEDRQKISDAADDFSGSK